MFNWCRTLRRWGLPPLLLTLLALPRPCGAVVAIVPVMPIGPYPTYVPYYEYREPFLEVDNQYFELNLGGLLSLCRARPELCQSAEQHSELQSLRHRRVAGVSLLVAGIAGLVGGTAWSLSTVREDAAGFTRSANWTPLYVGLGVGVALPLVGGIVMPHSGEVVDFINTANRLHPDEPVHIHLSAGPQAAPQLAVSLRF